jgi:hypothetical protein
MSDVDLLFITCPPRVAKALMEELEDKLAEQRNPACVLKYGVMYKAVHGFIILTCPYPDGFPSNLLDAIQKDEEISGYVLVTSDNASQEPPRTGREA